LELIVLQRIEYPERLKKFQNKKLIKIITGIRRCGKSTLLTMFKDDLLKNEIAEEQIQFINFEDADFENLTNYRALHEHIKNNLIPDKMNYIFLDEIQNVSEFQKVVNSLYIRENVDLYITGSNAHLLSGEIATLLSGRYVEIKMLPLSFKEYMSFFRDQTDLARKYRDYLVNSSFPYALALNGDKTLIRDYLSGIYNTVVLKDIVARKNIADVAMLESVIRFMFDNIGSLVSVKKISDTLTSGGRKISAHTVDTYLSALVDSYILNKVERYDIKGKQHLKTFGKYYITDIGLRYFLLGSRSTDWGRILENIVYLELIRRNYEVYVGKIDENEVDFVAVKGGHTEYFQV
jgi:predicted AAA+ superfamily ATPase